MLSVAGDQSLQGQRLLQLSRSSPSFLQDQPLSLLSRRGPQDPLGSVSASAAQSLIPAGPASASAVPFGPPKPSRVCPLPLLRRQASSLHRTGPPSLPPTGVPPRCPQHLFRARPLGCNPQDAPLASWHPFSTFPTRWSPVPCRLGLFPSSPRSLRPVGKPMSLPSGVQSVGEKTAFSLFLGPGQVEP